MIFDGKSNHLVFALQNESSIVEVTNDEITSGGPVEVRSSSYEIIPSTGMSIYYSLWNSQSCEHLELFHLECLNCSSNQVHDETSRTEATYF